ncbi:hypothetical protein B0H63DRAFT_454452 [Podospora didyma]|uniref:Integral membrane protein n=1 Tax=Podospora didyma TaxID=330526 RepID=A0AAE0N5K1_9PEZI|nr:hypothetical protein B0H63DRAFT_454452 [Podospora didyma]
MSHSTGRPTVFLSPTTRCRQVVPTPPAPRAGGDHDSSTVERSPQPPTHVIYHVWRSRDNRKGRHSAVVPREHADKLRVRATDTVHETLRGLARMVMRYPVWDISYDVAVVFTLGSVVWVINGCFVWLPLIAPWTEFSRESILGGGVTAFIGATIFEFGSVLLMLEAVNENPHTSLAAEIQAILKEAVVDFDQIQFEGEEEAYTEKKRGGETWLQADNHTAGEDCFGWALEEAFEDHEPRLYAEYEKCRHHHHDKRSWLKSSAVANVKAAKNTAEGKENDRPLTDGRRWSWWPTWRELTTHYFREVGFLACLSQMIGATIFWIAGFTGLPPIYDALSVPATNGIYWLPQVVGGTGFIVSSIFFMAEVQEKWYIPAPKLLGWHIGLWNLVGAIGFTLCGALGFASEQPGIEYALTLSTFIGSWAFFIGSVIQWFESLDKYPISVGNVPLLSAATAAAADEAA